MSESAELEKLGELHRTGVLSDEEFARAKARVLSGAAASAGANALSAAVNALHRSRNDRWLGGVCGGIAVLTRTSAWIWRMLFTLLVLFAGTGALLYVLLWIFVPEEASMTPARPLAN